MRKWGIIDMTSQMIRTHNDTLAHTKPTRRSHRSWYAGDGAATILAAVIAALMVVVGYFIQQSFARRERPRACV